MSTTAPPTSTKTLADAFLATADARGDAPALLHGDLTVALPWCEYAKQASRAAGGLAALGLRRGDTLGLLLSNRPEFHVADSDELTPTMKLKRKPIVEKYANQIESLYAEVQE